MRGSFYFSGLSLASSREGERRNVEKIQNCLPTSSSNRLCEK